LFYCRVIQHCFVPTGQFGIMFIRYSGTG